MNVYKSIMQGLQEAVQYQQGAIEPRRMKQTAQAVPQSKDESDPVVSSFRLAPRTPAIA